VNSTQLPRRMTRTQLPETLGAAREWDRRRNAYAAAGLCDADAATAAWGHSDGWARILHAPCTACAPIVAAMPEDTAHASWRKYSRSRAGAPSVRSTASVGVSASADLAAASTGTPGGRRMFGVLFTPAHDLTGEVVR